MRNKDVTNPQIQGLTTEIEHLSEVVARLEGQLKGRKDLISLTTQKAELMEQVENLKIQSARITETHERETREVKHMVGLEKKRQEVELTQARKDAELNVREHNLDADKKRFEEHLQFQQKQMDSHIRDIKDLLAQVMDRIPTVNVDVVRDH